MGGKKKEKLKVGDIYIIYYPPYGFINHPYRKGTFRIVSIVKSPKVK